MSCSFESLDSTNQNIYDRTYFPKKPSKSLLFFASAPPLFQRKKPSQLQFEQKTILWQALHLGSSLLEKLEEQIKKASLLNEELKKWEIPGKPDFFFRNVINQQMLKLQNDLWEIRKTISHSGLPEPLSEKLKRFTFPTKAVSLVLEMQIMINQLLKKKTLKLRTVKEIQDLGKIIVRQPCSQKNSKYCLEALLSRANEITGLFLETTKTFQNTFKSLQIELVAAISQNLKQE